MNFLQFGSWLTPKLSDELLYNQESSTTDLSIQDFFSQVIYFQRSWFYVLKPWLIYFLIHNYAQPTVNLLCKIYWS